MAKNKSMIQHMYDRAGMQNKPPVVGPKTKRQQKRIDKKIITPLSPAENKRANEKLAYTRKTIAATVGPAVAAGVGAITAVIGDRRRRKRWEEENPGFSTPMNYRELKDYYKKKK